MTTMKHAKKRHRLARKNGNGLSLREFARHMAHVTGFEPPLSQKLAAILAGGK